MKIKSIIFYIYTPFVLCFMFSCSLSKKPNDFLYFQKNLDNSTIEQLKERVIQVNDILNIQVISNSLNQEQTNLFNLPNNPNNNSGLMVNESGNIEMPGIGSIQASGLTKSQLQKVIVSKISLLVKDPIVLVRFSDFKVNVLGEVVTPGVKSFQKDKVTIIDAISAAGDLTDYGKREDIKIIREDDTSRKYYNIDLRNGELFQSPAFQLQPNDIVYVGANAKKIKNLKTNPNGQRGLQIFVALTSVASALIYLIANISRN